MSILRPYPAEFISAAGILVVEVPKLVKGEADTAAVIHASYEVLGYALGKLFPDGVVNMKATASVPALSREELVEVLKPCCDGTMHAASIDAIPWLAIAKAVLMILAQLLP